MAKLRGKPPATDKKRRAKILIFGAGGEGKTWGATGFPGVYYMDCEGGGEEPEYIDRLKVAGATVFGRKDGAGDFEAVVNECQTLATVEHAHRTVVIDSFTKIFQARTADREEQMRSRGDKVEFGVEKKPAVALARRLVNWMDRADMNFILICHQKEKWEKRGNSREAVGFTFDGWDKLEYELDLIIRVERRGDKYVGIVTKTRIATFPLNDTFDWGYDEFAKRFGKERLEAGSTAIELATPEQVARLEQLLPTAGYSDSTLSEWRKKAKVEGWTEMDTETIGKCIAACETRIKKATEENGK